MFVSSGNDFLILNFNLTTSALNITTTRAFKSAYIQARGDSNVLIRRVGSDSAYTTLKAGSGFRIDCERIPDSGSTTTICDARTETGTEVLEVILTI